MHKYKIRKHFLQLRKKKFQNKNKIDFNIIYNLIKKNVEIKGKIIGGYYPVNYEIDDLEILKRFENKKIKIALPKIKKNFNMEFHLWSYKINLKLNKYGIPEPDSKNKVYPDILMVPLVAFDKYLNRLGYGAGYYDRLIQAVKRRKKILTIGLAFDFQKYNKIPINKYDQKLDLVITNKKIY